MRPGKAMTAHDANNKMKGLLRQLETLKSLLVAFSGGVDSTFLLAVAHQVLGDRVLAVTAVSPLHPLRERKSAIRFVEGRHIMHRVLQSDEMERPEFLANGPDRCYWCKHALFLRLLNFAEKKNIESVAHGANFDDLDDYRPGSQAARELGIIAPLYDACMTKEDIRFLSRKMGLPTWNKPALACLATRIPYGEPVTEQRLQMVEKAEEFLLAEGFRQCRVRHHGPVARIEVEQGEIQKICDGMLRKKIVDQFRKIGFLQVAVDLEGYSSGSMNRGHTGKE